ncbi:plasmid partitioning protein RepB [Agrobacterium sp.]|uniref:plasmid partitioning protein RepB n=1 Tax=Agrobacterium sp. TaxID=361 RepID=UPI0028B26261|nr:plasmid partitioning protein RepB [Agrobacterium sp.]
MVGNARKNELKALFGGALPVTATPAANPETPPAPPVAAATATAVESAHASATPARAPSGAVRAMGLSLGSMTREADEARALRQAMSDGEHVLSIDPAQIDASFVEDRLTVAGVDDEDFNTLMKSIRESGQQVPVLLRPHPEKQGRYQTAYGHRRIRAALKLGQPVKAIVRPLNDDELVLAQGKENAERRNLSFIERAIFAKNLADRGFDRKVIGDALSVQKSELSRLLQVIDNVPLRFITMVGAAPKAGRDRWLKLGEMLKGSGAEGKALEAMRGEGFETSQSDQRFELLFKGLSARSTTQTKSQRPRELRDAKGKVFATLRLDGKAPRIDFVGKTDPDFLEKAVELLAREYAAHMAKG